MGHRPSPDGRLDYYSGVKTLLNYKTLDGIRLPHWRCRLFKAIESVVLPDADVVLSNG